MLNTDDTFSGICVLKNDRTGAVYRVAVLIAPSADTITYTAQTIDRSQTRTATWDRDRAQCFLEMMELVDQVGADRRLA